MNRITKIYLSCLILLLAGCSNNLDKDLLDTVPADTKFIAVTNLDAIVKNAGCKVVNGVITLSPEIQKLVDETDAKNQVVVKRLIAMASAIDISRIVTFTDNANSQIVTFQITKPELFNTAMQVSVKNIRSDDDFTVYTLDNFGIIATNENQGWIAESIDKIKDCVKSSEKNPFSKNVAAYKVLENSSAFNCAINIRDKNITDSTNSLCQFLCNSTTLNDNSIESTFTILNDKGNAINISPYLSPIETDIAKFFPDNSQVVLAVGKPHDTGAVADFISGIAQTDLQQTQMLSLVLKALDGPIAIGATPASDGESLYTDPLNSWDITAAAKFDSQSLDQILSLLNIASLSEGVTVYNDDVTGQRCIDYMYGKVYYDNFDNYLAVSTSPVSDANTGVYAPDFNNCYAAFIANIPYNSSFTKAYRLPYGFSINAILLKDNLSVTIRVNGSNSSILKSLIEILLSVNREQLFFNSSLKNNGDTYSEQDDDIDYDTYD